MTAAVVEVSCRAGCSKCAGVQRWLAGLGRPFVVHDVTADPAAARRIAPLGFSSLPVLLTSDGRAAVGADPAALAAALPLLAAAAGRASQEQASR